MTYLDSLDKAIFEWVIIYMNPVWLTEICIEFTRPKYIAVILIPFFGIKLKKDFRNTAIALLLFILLIGISDLMANELKSLIGRERPGSQTGLYIREKAFTMPSSHAWNSMASAVFIKKRFIGGGWYFILLSFLIGIARFISAYHFLLDVIVGWTGGFLLGWFYFTIVKKFLPMNETVDLRNKIKG